MRDWDDGPDEIPEMTVEFAVLLGVSLLLLALGVVSIFQ